MVNLTNIIKLIINNESDKQQIIFINNNHKDMDNISFNNSFIVF